MEKDQEADHRAPSSTNLQKIQTWQRKIFLQQWKTEINNGKIVSLQPNRGRSGNTIKRSGCFPVWNLHKNLPSGPIRN